MKTCIECRKVKSLDEFTNQTKTKKNSRCKPCMNKKSSDYRKKMTALVGRWKVIKGCCNEECSGFPKHRAALHLAHKEPKLAHYKHSGAYKPWWSKKRIKEELAKCRVLCANCHSIETYDEEHYNLWKHKPK